MADREASGDRKNEALGRCDVTRGDTTFKPLGGGTIANVGTSDSGFTFKGVPVVIDPELPDDSIVFYSSERGALLIREPLPSYLTRYRPDRVDVPGLINIRDDAPRDSLVRVLCDRHNFPMYEHHGKYGCPLCTNERRGWGFSKQHDRDGKIEVSNG